MCLVPYSFLLSFLPSFFLLLLEWVTKLIFWRGSLVSKFPYCLSKHVFSLPSHLNSGLARYWFFCSKSLSCRITNDKSDAGLILFSFSGSFSDSDIWNIVKVCPDWGEGSFLSSFVNSVTMFSGSTHTEIFGVSSAVGTVPLLALKMISFYPFSGFFFSCLLLVVFRIYISEYSHLPVFHALSLFSYILRVSSTLSSRSSI